MQSTKCKIFLKGFCPRKELCQNSHDIKNCMSGLNCKIKKECPDRHPPLCKNFVKNTCGFLVGSKFIVYSNCAFFHPPGVNQEPTSINSVMLTTTATVQNTPQDARSEIEVKSGISPADQVTKQLSDLNSKIVKLEQNLSLLADKMDNMDSKINQVGEAIKQVDSMQTSLDHLANDFNHQATNIKDLQEKISSNAREINLFQGLQDIVKYLEKEVECGGDSRLAKILKKEIKQDLRQEMDIIKTDITNKVERKMLAELHPQMVKEIQQLHET